MSDPTAMANAAAGRRTRPGSTAIGTAVQEMVAKRKAAEQAAQTGTTPKVVRRRKKKAMTSGEIHVARAKAGTPESYKGGFLDPSKIESR